MPIFSLSDQLIFPPPAYAEPDGLVAVGGDLGPDRLLLAYRTGIFPWFSPGDPILWWSPDPRFVMKPQDIKISKSMKQVISRGTFRITYDQAFEQVISNCKSIPRDGQPGTWITNEMKRAYCHLHDLGYAHSVEAWQDDELVGGLYGVSLGGAFFGESMFSRVSNASKAAFIHLAQHLQTLDFSLIDCQMHTAHLESLGASNMDRDQFLTILEDEMDRKDLFVVPGD